MPSYRKIEPADDARIAEIVRANLKHFHLDIPGTAYFDPELEHLSAFYDAEPSKRRYFVALDDAGQVVGGAGIAEFKGSELLILVGDDQTAHQTNHGTMDLFYIKRL